MSTKKTDKFTAHTAAIAEAIEEADRARDYAQQARAYVDEVRGRIRALDPSVTSNDLLGAVAMVEFANIRANGHASKVDQLKRTAPFHPIVAEAVAHFLGEHFGFAVLVVDRIPTTQPKTVPTLYVVQEQAADRAGGFDPSHFVAPVRLTLVREAFHRALDPNLLADVLAARSANVRTNMVGGETDDLRLTVTTAPVLPHFAAPTDRNAQDAARTVASYFVGGRAVDFQTRDGEAIKAGQLKATTENDGVRTSVVRVQIEHDGIVPARPINQTLTGMVLRGLGRVTAVEPVQATNSGAIYNVTAQAAIEPYANVLAIPSNRPVNRGLVFTLPGDAE
jgi:hypothetical protein